MLLKLFGLIAMLSSDEAAKTSEENNNVKLREQTRFRKLDLLEIYFYLLDI